MTAPDRPRISLVVPSYNVERYLPDFIASVERQLTDDVEVVLVNDGSTDATGRIGREWRERSRHRIAVLEQENAGPSAARNAGMRVAAGTWISFPDADDVIGPGYLARASAFLRSRQAETATIVATNLQMLDDASGTVTDSHPLRGKFAHDKRVIRLESDPQTVQLHANSTFFRRAELERTSRRFDPRVRPNFEDAAFIAHVLLDASDPHIAVLPRAKYHYRRRADPGSLTTGSWADPAKYDDVLRYGYLPLLQRPATGVVPRWLQYAIVYDLSWYFRKDIQIHSQTSLLTDVQSDRFYALATEVLGYIDSETLTSYRVAHLSDEIRAVLLALKGELPSPPEIRTIRKDAEQQLTKVSYFEMAGGSSGPIDVAIDGEPVIPAYTKRRGVTYLGRTALIEVVSWLPGVGSVTATRDEVPIRPRSVSRDDIVRQYSPHSGAFRRLLDAAKLGLQLVLHDRPKLLQLIVQADISVLSKGNGLPFLARFVPGRAKFRNCWLLIDRDDQAHDNAEHLYRHLRQNRADINAWFVLNRDSVDWARLEAEGFRLIAHNSVAHAVALAHCRELISSQIDHYIVSPPVVFWLRPHPWRFTWLQHGITKDDLSRWVNTKPVSTVIAATPREYESFVADGTPYVWTGREVALTGFPRHDALLRAASDVSDEDRRSLVFMPTWRRELLGDAVGNGNRRVTKADFWDSEYVRNWMGLIGSVAVTDAARRAGLDIIFMPHPNMTPHLAPELLPPGVRILNYSDNDVQEVLAHASHVVTDYSSNAFEAALVDRPVLYFQFDRDSFFNGEHAYRKGYFDYETEGFGPVCTTLNDAEADLIRLIESGKHPAEPYSSRISTTFPRRDGRACERVVDAIVAHRLPHHLPRPIAEPQESR